MSWMIRSVGRRGILRIHNDPSSEVYFDGIEVMNPSFAGRVTSSHAKHLNDTELHLAETGGSDSHTLSLIGTGLTYFEGRNEEAFRHALSARETRPDGHFWTREEVQALAMIGPRQMLRSLVILQDGIFVAPRAPSPSAPRPSPPGGPDEDCARHPLRLSLSGRRY